MIEITMSINGRPLTSNNIKDELEKVEIEFLKDNIRERLSSVSHELDGKRFM